MSEKKVCHLCHGKTTVIVNVTCTTCHGTGEINNELCKRCYGTGKVDEVRTCPYCLGTGTE